MPPKKRPNIVVKSTGHPASVRKLRCPVCKLGYAVGSPYDTKKFVCDRCGSPFTVTRL